MILMVIVHGSGAIHWCLEPFIEVTVTSEVIYWAIMIPKYSLTSHVLCIIMALCHVLIPNSIHSLHTFFEHILYFTQSACCF